jgi:ParB family chromosome partitioning protein
VSLTIDEKSTNAFGAFLVEQIPELYAAFRRRVDA